MALTTFRLTFLPRLRDGRQVRRYRQYLIESNTLASSSPLLKHLERLPLCVSPAKGGEMRGLREALSESPRIHLVTNENSEGMLALKQLCLQWAYGMDIEHTYFPLLLSLSKDAMPNETPINVLRRECERLGFESDDLSLKRGLAAGIWLFLLEGWDDLDAATQTQWANWITTCTERFPAVSMIIPSASPNSISPQFDTWHLHHLHV